MALINGRRFGWRRGPIGLAKLALLAAPAVVLPPLFSLRYLAYPIYDQGQWGTCTANSYAAAKRMAMWAAAADAAGLDWRSSLLPVQPIALEDPSRLFIYWNTEDSEGDPGVDNGATISDTAHAAYSHGICHEALWDYTPENFLKKPTCQAYRDGRRHPVPHPQQVNQTVFAIKASIYAGLPVQFGCDLKDGFESIGSSGIYTPTGGGLGGHALYVCGWDDDRQLLEVPNSWGGLFGDSGVVWFPYSVIESTACSDFVAVSA